MTALVELARVSKSFREGESVRTVFDGLDLRVAAGEFVVLFGRSGSGKSTLLHLMSGIDLPDAGTVHLGGVELTRLSETERTKLRRERIGFIFQFFNLIPTLSVEENVLFPLELSGRLNGASRARALELLDAVELADRARAFPDRLSGGEQQRVAVARALVHDPDLILADEPTGNLDDESAANVVALIERLLRPSGKTLALVTHDRGLHRIADRVLRVHDGRVEREGASA
jgi:putative ABC transport system ATP-binding protein